MSAVSDAQHVSTAERPLGVRRRPDLIVDIQTYEARRYFVIKDPLKLSYFRFHEEEYAILELLDGSRSLADIQEEFERRYVPQKLTLPDLQRFVGRLHQAQLIISDQPGQGRQLVKNAKRTKRIFRFHPVRLIYMKFPGFDPEKLLSFLYPWVKFCFTRTGAVCSVLLMIAAAVIAVVHIRDLTGAPQLQSFQAFFTLQNLFWLWVAMGGAKVVHELAHGLTCRHYGGECHEIGMLLLMLSPCLYCDTTDAWMMRNKWHRIRVNAAGMYSELVLASLAIFVWRFTQPGLVHNLALNTVFVCSVSTVVFNLNPLFRFDGYYILMDLIEIPNLRSKGTMAFRSVLAWLCMGIPIPHDPFRPRSHLFWFAVYSVARILYRTAVIVAILWMMYKIMKPLYLAPVGIALTVYLLNRRLIKPIIKLVQFLASPVKTVPISWLRISVTFTIIAALAGAAVFVPYAKKVEAPCIVNSSRDGHVYVTTSGRLKTVHARPGDYVSRGDLLLELTDYELSGEMLDLRRRRSELQSVARRFESLGLPDEARSARESMLGLDEMIRTREKQLDALKLRAPISGCVVAAPLNQDLEVADSRSGGRPWMTDILSESQIGRILPVGTRVCSVVVPEEVTADLIVDQSDIDFVAAGQDVEIRLDAFPLRTFEGTILTMSRRNVVAPPAQVGNRSGGDLPVVTDEYGNTRTLNSAYYARVRIQGAERANVMGLRGLAKIRGTKRTAIQRFWKYISETFYFRL